MPHAHVHIERRRRGQLRCDHCRTKIAWEIDKAVGLAAKAGTRLRRTYEARRKHLAIRCLWCLTVLCPKCARTHFVHISTAQDAVDKVLARVAAEALRKMEKSTKGEACAVRRTGTGGWV